MRSQEIDRKPQIWPASRNRNCATITNIKRLWLKSNQPWSQHRQFKSIPYMHSTENTRKPQNWPISPSQNCVKSENSTNHGPNVIDTEGSEGILANQMSCHSFHACCSEILPISLLFLKPAWPWNLTDDPKKETLCSVLQSNCLFVYNFSSHWS